MEENEEEAVEKARKNGLIDEGLKFPPPNGTAHPQIKRPKPTEGEAKERRPSWLVTATDATTSSGKRKKLSWGKKLAEVQTVFVLYLCSLHNLSAVAIEGQEIKVLTKR